MLQHGGNGTYMSFAASGPFGMTEDTEYISGCRNGGRHRCRTLITEEGVVYFYLETEVRWERELPFLCN